VVALVSSRDSHLVSIFREDPHDVPSVKGALGFGRGEIVAQSGLELLGRGLYSPTDGVAPHACAIRAHQPLTRGYWFIHHGKPQWSGPIVGSGAPEDRRCALSGTLQI